MLSTVLPPPVSAQNADSLSPSSMLVAGTICRGRFCFSPRPHGFGQKALLVTPSCPRSRHLGLRRQDLEAFPRNQSSQSLIPEAYLRDNIVPAFTHTALKTFFFSAFNIHIYIFLTSLLEYNCYTVFLVAAV